jgi:hypothetical protein
MGECPHNFKEIAKASRRYHKMRWNVRFPVPLKEGVEGRWLCYVAAPDGVSIELIQG